MAKTKIVPFLLLFTFFALRAHADSYGPLNFLLPPNWECSTEKSSYVCLDKSSSTSTSAIVVNFKNKTPEDSLVFYKSQLGQPRPLKDGEVVVPSEVKLVHEITLNGQQWIEAVHHNSELKGYFTHYFVTVAGPYALLVSISVSDANYQSEMLKLKPTIDSMRISLPQEINQQENVQPLQPGQTAQTPQPAPAAAENDFGTPAQNQNKYFHILGHRIRKPLAILGGAFFLALVLLIYAIAKD